VVSSLKTGFYQQAVAAVFFPLLAVLAGFNLYIRLNCQTGFAGGFFTRFTP
jgi:hypothetical protein